jgi:hypothetical protein
MVVNMPEIKLRVNNEDVPLNEIMQKVITNINVGFIKSLNGIPEDIKKIDLKIDRD